MANGLQTTWNVLEHTRNRSAVRVLAAALGSQSVDLHPGAIRASVHRKDTACHKFLIRRFAALEEPEQGALCEAHREIPFRLAAALDAAVLAGDATECESACRIILASRDYTRFPTLVRAAENRRHRHAEQVNAAMLQLATRLHQEVSDLTGSLEQAHRVPFFLRRQVIRALEAAVQNYARHQRLEIVEAFLLLAPADNATLMRALRDATYPCHEPVMSSLSTSKVPAMIELLVALLHDPAVPAGALQIIAERTDRRFLDVLLHSQKQPVSLRVLQNMGRLRSIEWLEAGRETLLDLDGRAQAAAIELAMASDIGSQAKFEVLAKLLRHGVAEGRRASCRALASIHRPEADELVREALADADASVQAAALRQLRQRQLPDALALLVSALDAASSEVRDAARSSLAEFNFVRYRAMFELLDEKTLHTTGVLVRKVDPSSLDRLTEELTSPSSTTRRRGIAMTVAMESAADVRPTLIALAEDEDVSVRLEAVKALAHCRGSDVVSALVMATQDPHRSVREAAAASLVQVRATVRISRDRLPATPGGTR